MGKAAGRQAKRAGQQRGADAGTADANAIEEGELRARMVAFPCHGNDGLSNNPPR